MSKLQILKKSIIFIDYVPAELKSDWRIVFQAKNPLTGELERKRRRVKPLKSIKQRRELAKMMCDNINAQLRKDPNTFFKVKGTKEFTLFDLATKRYLDQLKKEVQDKNISDDTYRTYNSKIKCIKEYIIDIGLEKMYCHQLDNDFITEHLDYIRYEINKTARTRDNYFTFYTTLTNWLKAKKYIIESPCEGLKKINKQKTEKQIINAKDREIIFNYYKAKNFNFLIFCLFCFYCLVRSKELSLLKVSDVNLRKNTLWISASNAKTNKSAHVTIPNRLAILLVKHLQYSNPEDYLFSDNNYTPGPLKFKPSKSSSNWRRMRKKLNLDSKIKWYYLKDSGIVDLIIKGVPLHSVRDQARHHNISQTNDYIPKQMKIADPHILNSGVNFLKEQ